ncbi:MAG: hemophore [Mycobacterium sp.]|nr:hemophore [Mycobacterium sp.]
MNPPNGTTARRSRLAAAAACGIAALSAAGLGAPTVTAAPDPCAASEVAKTVAMVATHTGNYLEANPETDQALTTVSQQQGGPQSAVALKAYLDANPQVAGDLQRLQQPLVSLSGRCKLPVTVPQVLGLMHAAQQSPALAGRVPSAQTVGVDSAPAPRPASATPVTPSR